MTEQLNVQQMAEKLLAADNILILCHKNPDGDTAVSYTHLDVYKRQGKRSVPFWQVIHKE